MTVFLFIALVISVAYFIFMGWLFFGLSTRIGSTRGHCPGLTIVVPFRNEEESIGDLIMAVAQQEYPIDQIELLLVNDHSEDGGLEIIDKLSQSFPQLTIKLLSLRERSGKKAALYKGVTEARHSIILQTDADCNPDPYWVANAVQPFEDPAVMASLGVVKMTGRSLMQRLFSLEFLSLQASGLALVQRGIPVMANGANLAYRREIWLKYHPRDKGWSSGDDVFFIQQLALKDPKAIHHNGACRVSTPSPQNLKAFIEQRVRWGSKTPAYPLRVAQYIAYLVVAENVMLVLCFLAGLLISPDFLAIYIALTGLKSLPEYLLVRSFAKISDQRSPIRLFPVAAILYPFYIVVSGAIILFGSRAQRWKGRPLQS
ncbi:MAG: glycosyltransferase [Owenweeksia sp.]